MSAIMGFLTAELNGKVVYRSEIFEDGHEFGRFPTSREWPLLGSNIIGSASLNLSKAIKDFPIELCLFTVQYGVSDSEPLRFEGKFVGTEIGGDSIFDIYSFLDFPQDCEESAAKISKEPTTVSLSDREDESTEGFKVLQYVAIDEVVTEKLKVKVSEWPPSVIKAEFGGETFYYNLADCHKKS